MNIRRSIQPITLLIGVLTLLTSSLAFVITSQVGAQEARESITLSPVKKNYTVQAGQTVSDTLTVLNDGTTAYDFIVYATPYSVANGSYIPNFNDDKPNSDAYKWVQFEQTTYRAEPRETITIPFTLQVRDTASPGGHYGAIFAEIQPDTSKPQTGVVVQKRVSTLLFATVSGDVDVQGKTTAISIPWFQTQPPLGATTSVTNTGNTDFTTKVTLKVENLFGNLKYTKTQEYSVLPETTRDIQVQWQQANWFGLYKTTVSTETLGTTTTGWSYVLMMPLWFIVLLIVCSVAGGVYAYFAQKKQKKTPKDDANKTPTQTS